MKKNGRKAAAGVEAIRWLVCAICQKSIGKLELYFSIETHEKAICEDCIKRMFPICPTGQSLARNPISIHWRLV